MKKFYNKLSELITEDIKYANPNYISALDIINVYLKGYKNTEEDLINESNTNVLRDYLGKDIDCKLSYADYHKIRVIACDLESKETLEFVFDCHNINELQLIDAKYNENVYRPGDIEMFRGIIAPEVINYYSKYNKMLKTYDRSHPGMNSVNSKFSLYLVDNEAIVFPGNCSHMDIKMNDDGSLDIDCRNMELFIQAGLYGKEEKLLSNVYFNIEDAPEFIRQDLYEKRNDEVKNINIQPNINKPLKRVRTWLKK